MYRTRNAVPWRLFFVLRPFYRYFVCIVHDDNDSDPVQSGNDSAQPEQRVCLHGSQQPLSDRTRDQLRRFWSLHCYGVSCSFSRISRDFERSLPSSASRSLASRLSRRADRRRMRSLAHCERHMTSVACFEPMKSVGLCSIALVLGLSQAWRLQSPPKQRSILEPASRSS